MTVDFFMHKVKRLTECQEPDSSDFSVCDVHFQPLSIQDSVPDKRIHWGWRQVFLTMQQKREWEAERVRVKAGGSRAPTTCPHHVRAEEKCFGAPKTRNKNRRFGHKGQVGTILHCRQAPRMGGDIHRRSDKSEGCHIWESEGDICGGDKSEEWVDINGGVTNQRGDIHGGRHFKGGNMLNLDWWWGGGWQAELERAKVWWRLKLLELLYYMVPFSKTAKKLISSEEAMLWNQPRSLSGDTPRVLICF